MIDAFAPPRRFTAVLRRFFADDAGAVTVDFVVITAAIVGLTIAVTASIASGADDLADAQARCMNRIAANMQNENLSFETKMTRMRNQCRNQ